MSPRKNGRFDDLSGGGLGIMSVFVFAALLFLAYPPRVSAGFTELREATLKAFKDYLAKAEQRNQESLRAGAFLWTDNLPEAERKEAYAKLKQGGVWMQRISEQNSAGATEVPDGMIHDWEGIVFIPGAELEQVLAILQDYNNQAIYYAPDVERAKIESHDGDHYRVFLRFRRQKIVTVVLNTEHEVTYFRDSPTRAHSRSSAVRIQEVVNPGTKEEKEKAPGDDNGFLWQMETWWRMEERDGGVYVQNEAITLTRDIPTGLGWLIGPFVTSIPRETLEFTLGNTRKAVLSKGIS